MRLQTLAGDCHQRSTNGAEPPDAEVPILTSSRLDPCRCFASCASVRGKVKSTPIATAIMFPPCPSRGAVAGRRSTSFTFPDGPTAFSCEVEGIRGAGRGATGFMNPRRSLLRQQRGGRPMGCRVPARRAVRALLTGNLGLRDGSGSPPRQKTYGHSASGVCSDSRLENRYDHR